MKHMGINIDYYSKGTLMMETHSSFILPKESPLVVSLNLLTFCARIHQLASLQAKFSTTVMWLKDTGILNKLKFDAMSPPIPIPDPKLRHKQPLILRQLSIIFILLVVGLSIAFIAFLSEVCLRSRNNGREADYGTSLSLTVMKENPQN